MANHLISCIDYDAIVKEMNAINAYKCDKNHKNLLSFNATLSVVINDLKVIYPALANHITTTIDNSNQNKQFISKDYAVLYLNDSNNTINLGKWNGNTLWNHDQYNPHLVSNSVEQLRGYLLNYLRNNNITVINIDKTYEIRLPKQDDTGGKPDVYRGTAIEVQRVQPCVEDGSSSYRGQACES